jgi:hypothetical protein
MKKIEFCIIGAPKSGTTFLHKNLEKIPEHFNISLIKETKIFTDDSLYESFPKNITSFFNNLDDRPLGMSDVEILYHHEKSASRIYSHNPEIKLIVLLRNPVKRAYSAFWFSKKNQREQADTFEEAISLTEKNTDRKSDKAYLDVGLYYNQIITFYKYFPERNILIVSYEDAFEDKEAFFRKVLRFLGIKDFKDIDLSLVEESINKGGETYSPVLQNFLLNENSLKELYQKIVPLSARVKLRRRIFSPLTNLNSKKSGYYEMSKETNDKLNRYFFEDVKNLSHLTGINFLDKWGIKVN